MKCFINRTLHYSEIKNNIQCQLGHVYNNRITGKSLQAGLFLRVMTTWPDHGILLLARDYLTPVTKSFDSVVSFFASPGASSNSRDTGTLIPPPFFHRPFKHKVRMSISYIPRFSHQILLCEKAFRILLRPIREAKGVSHT